MTTTPTAKRVEVTETGRVYIDRKPLPFATSGATATIAANGKDTRVTLTVPVDGEVCIGGLGDPAEYPAPGVVAIMALDYEDARATAKALGIEAWGAYTIANAHAVADGKGNGRITTAAIATSRFTFRAAQGDAYAYDIAARVLRELAKYEARG